MRGALVAVPIALCASAAAASFHPVEDRPYRYDTVETRTADGATRRFHASRTIVFHRAADGYDAIVTLQAIDQQADGDVGRMFVAATGALLHHPLRYRLDAAGMITGVDGADAVVALVADAIERMTATGSTRAGHSKALASPLRTAPLERKVAMLRSVLLPVIAGAAADRTPGQANVRLPSRPPLPPGTDLSGTETVSRGASGVVTIDVVAHGGIDATAPPDAPGARIATPAHALDARVHTVRNIDAAAGLVLDSRETSEATLSDGDTLHTVRIETVITLTPAPK